MVKLPPAFRITRNAPVPATSWAGAGSEALASDARIWIECVTLGTSAQEASHAFTVMKKGTPAVCGLGVPVLPDGVPEAAVSPGSNTCNRVNGPANAVAVLSWAAKTSASHKPPRAARSAWRTTNLLSTFVRCSSGDQTRPAPSPRFRVRGGRGDAQPLLCKAGRVPGFVADCAVHASARRSVRDKGIALIAGRKGGSNSTEKSEACGNLAVMDHPVSCRPRVAIPARVAETSRAGQRC